MIAGAVVPFVVDIFSSLSTADGRIAVEVPIMVGSAVLAYLVGHPLLGHVRVRYRVVRYVAPRPRPFLLVARPWHPCLADLRTRWVEGMPRAEERRGMIRRSPLGLGRRG